MKPPSLLLLMLLGLTLAGSAQDAREPSPDIRWGEKLLVQIAVSDLDRSVEFYRDTLGLPFEQRVDEIRWAKFALPTGAQLGMGQSNDVKGSGTTSINLSVTDLDAARATLEQRGVVFLGPTIEIPGVVRLADFLDPDGNKIRLAGASKQAR